LHPNQEQPVSDKTQNGLWWEICSELDLYGSNWPPQLARILLVMADHAERVTDHVQDDTTMVQDVAAWLRYEAQLAMESELNSTNRHHRDTP
jgi:hypothetical protein